MSSDQAGQQGQSSKPPPRPPAGGQKTIMRSLGEFFGHIAHGIRTPARPPAEQARDGQPAMPGDAEANRRVVRETVEEEERDTPQGKVTLRRTIIEEVELPPGPQPPSSGPT